MGQLRVYLLGTPQIEVDGRAANSERRKAVALLAYLLVTGTRHGRETLANLFWPDYEQARALAYLRRGLWEVNQAFGDEWLVVERESVGLNEQADIWLDVAEFRHLTPPQSAFAQLQEGVALYRGDFMAGFSLRDSPDFDAWQQFQSEALRRELAAALQQLSTTATTHGDQEAALQYAQRWVTLDPLHEPAHRHLMRLYASTGRRTAALRQYDTIVQALQEELGVAPEAATQHLYQQIARNERPAGEAFQPTPPVPPPAPQPPPLQLPVPPTPFIGRDLELSQLQQLLASPAARLVTLAGPGGSGKTRLALEVARRYASNYSDGVYFVGLAPLSNSDQIVPALARTLGFSFYEERERREQLLDYLHQKRMLIVLDNYEHLLANGSNSASVAAEILQRAPHITLVVTSRTRLNVQGEYLYPVAGLPLPELDQVDGWSETAGQGDSYSAVELFIQRARQVRPDFRPDANSLSEIATICRLVQGMPLAIELAAAWMELLTPAEIAREIESSLDFLETEAGDVPARQRSLRTVFESSWKLLTPAERDSFQKLTVFRGGFTHEAAQAVTGASLRTLLTLANKSWIQRREDGRYDLHEVLRQYAAETLQATPQLEAEVYSSHANYYAGWIQTQGNRLSGEGQRTALIAITSEVGNVRQAWEWSIQAGDFERLVDQMLLPIAQFANLRSVWEDILPLISQALAAFDQQGVADVRLRTILTIAHAASLAHGWRIVEVHPWLSEAWELAGRLRPDPLTLLGPWYIMLVDIYGWHRERREAARIFYDLVDRLQGKEERWILAWVWHSLGEFERSFHALDKAKQAFETAEKLYRQLGDSYRLAQVLRELCALVRTQGDHERAIRLITEAVALFSDEDVDLTALKRPEDWRALLFDLYQRVIARLTPGSRDSGRAGLSMIGWELAEISIQEGRFQESFAFFQAQRQLCRTLGIRRLEIHSIHWESLVSLRHGSVEQALQLRLQHLEMTRQGEQYRNQFAWSLWELGEVYRVAGEVTLARNYFEQSAQHFQEMGEAMGQAFYHRGLGDLALSAGDYTAAEEHFMVYLETAATEFYHWSTAYALTGLGRAALGLDHHTKAKAHFLESLRMAGLEGNRDLWLLPLTGLAQQALAEGQPAVAAELAALVVHHPLTWIETRAWATTVLDATLQTGEPAVQAAERGRNRELAAMVASLLSPQDTPFMTHDPAI